MLCLDYLQARVQDCLSLYLSSDVDLVSAHSLGIACLLIVFQSFVTESLFMPNGLLVVVTFATVWVPFSVCGGIRGSSVDPSEGVLGQFLY